jgi:hypothetical protein
MSKVVVIIGGSHAGKSSFVRNSFVRGRIGELQRDLMPYTEFDDCILIGRYDTGEKRRDGTDSVERKQVGNFAQQVMNLLPKNKTIVLEGMRCVSRPMMNKLLDNGVDVGIIWIHISPETSFARNQAFGNKLTLDQAKRIDTTSRNFIRDYTGNKKKSNAKREPKINGLTIPEYIEVMERAHEATKNSKLVFK